MQERYATDSKEELLLRGQIALTKRGINFAMQQLASGVSTFKTMLNEDILDVDNLKKLITQIDDDVDDAEVNDEDGDDEEGDEDESDAGDDGVSGGHGSGALDATAGRIQTYVPHIDPRADNFGNILWRFPLEYSQGNVCGRNGSSACSIIALCIANDVVLHNPTVPMEGTLDDAWVTLLYKCMVSGNDLYDQYRTNLPARYLSAAEACDILSGTNTFVMQVEEPLPVRLHDIHHMSTIAAQLQKMVADSCTKLAVFTIADKTSLFVVSPPCILFVDTHCHVPDADAVIVQGKCHLLDQFVQSVWDLQGLDPDTFGNLVHLFQI